jgi:hypothetical protein
MLVFDRRSLRCVVPPTEDCDIPTTPTPLEGEIGGGGQPIDDNDYQEGLPQSKSLRQKNSKTN